MTKRIIGLYQLITGIFGAVFIPFSYYSKGFNAALLPQVIAGVVLFGLVGWAGYGIINKRKNAVKYSKILQALQIVSFTLSGTVYRFTAGAFIVFGLKNGSFTYGIGSQVVDFALANTSSNDTTIVFYLIPIVLLIGLIKLKS